MMGDLGLVIAYLMVPFIVIAICILVNRLITRFTPKVAIILGSNKK